MYVDRLLEQGLAADWGICGVGVMPVDLRMRDVLHAQDGLYTLVVEHADGNPEARVIGSIVDYRHAPDDPEATIVLLAAPSTRIVSMTITEGSYHVDASDTSMFDLIAEALARRRDRGIASPTIVSCDNIEANGEAGPWVVTNRRSAVHLPVAGLRPRGSRGRRCHGGPLRGTRAGCHPGSRRAPSTTLKSRTATRMVP